MNDCCNLPHPHLSVGTTIGYFEFGGSTVVVIGEPGKWKPDPDIVERTISPHMETRILLGQPIAKKI